MANQWCGCAVICCSNCPAAAADTGMKLAAIGDNMADIGIRPVSNLTQYKLNNIQHRKYNDMWAKNTKCFQLVIQIPCFLFIGCLEGLHRVK